MGIEREARPAPAMATESVLPGKRRSTEVLRRSRSTKAVVVGAHDDAFERDADRLAESVVGTLGRRAASMRGAAPSRIRRAAAPLVGAAGGEVGGEVATRIRARRGGVPLEPSVRSTMESAFGADFVDVRVHRGAEADSLNDALGARAFTFGPDIHLGAGAGDPSSPAGMHVLAHELAHVVQQDGARVHRFIDRAGLVALAGAPHMNIGLKRRSVEYKTVLDLLDRYHAESQRVWTANLDGATVRGTLEPILDQLAAACWDYVKEQGDESDRAAHVREVVSREIPIERNRVRAVTSDAGFAALDRTRPVGLVGTAKPAVVTDVGIDVGTTKVHDQAENGTADCHSMAFWFEIDAGTNPAPPPGAPKASVYGVTVEYWESVEIPYHFTTNDPNQVAGLRNAGEGRTLKQWNDVLALEPGSGTFSTIGGQIEMSWVAGVAAANGGLVGKHKIGFQDNPGVTPKPGKHIKRIVRFRIVVKDGLKRREILATQVIECDGTLVPRSMTYVDSLGNRVGKERANVRGVDELADMPANDARLAAHDVTPGGLAAGVPGQARLAVRAFVRKILSNTAAPFVNKELTAVQTRFPTATEQGAGPYKAYARMGKKKYGTADDYYEIAGMNALPFPVNGTTYLQHAVGGALLVAITEGTTIRRMYYTTNKSRKVGREQLRFRSFAELPIENVLAYVPTETEYLKLSNADRAAHDQIAQAEGMEQLQVAAAQLGATNAFARGDGPTLTYLRRNITDYDLIEAEFDRTQAPRTMAGLLKAEFDGDLGGHAPTAARYRRHSNRYPNVKALAILRQSFIDKFKLGGANDDVAQTQFAALLAANRATIGAAPALIGIANVNANNHAGLVTAVMQYLRTNKRKAPTVENDYNTAIPALNLPGVPATLGEIVNEHFESELRANGKGLAVFDRLANEYPDFEYRLRPAYRFVFGDDALRTVTERRRAARAAGDVSDAGAAVNLAAKQAFLAQGLYTMNNFASSIESAAKFDVAYDPATTKLKVTVKLSFTWNDSTQQPAKIQNKEVGKQYSQTAWTDASKAKFKADLFRNILTIWNANPPVIRCVKPGWEDVTARPVFELVEVAHGGGQHNNISATKAVLSTPTNQPKQLKAQGVSAWGKTDTGLKEFDVADKISDPTVHQYLHQPERVGNIAPAYQTDHDQLTRRLAVFGKLAFAAGNSRNLVEAERIDILVGELQRLALPKELAHLHGLEVVGDAAGGDVALAGRRADTVIRRLRRKGISNPIQKVIGHANVDTVTVRASAPDPNIVDTYVRKWSRISAAHEFGHMLGLMDEYYGAKSDTVVKQMISEGMLPPSTRGDHFTANPPTTNLQETKGQTAEAELLEKANLGAPDFTLQDNAKSSSIMTGGYELWPQHYVTVWEALTRLTDAHIAAKYWKLG